jgi:hypothetical protein
LTELSWWISRLTSLQRIDLSCCKSLTELPSWISSLTSLQHIVLSGCKSLTELPSWISSLASLQRIHLSNCESLTELPSGMSSLTSLQHIDLSRCKSLTELPVELSVLPRLETIRLYGCDALHTPPQHVVREGTGAVLQFLRDLASGSAACHLVKVVLVGEQRAGKSSLADSLVLGCPAPRAVNDRTVGIEVRRWPVAGGSPVVAHMYDAAGQHVYRATHGLFMSAGALFLHVLRSDMSESSEDESVKSLLEWVGAVQQEAPGAVMAVVWTHVDCCGVHEPFGGKSWQQVYVDVAVRDTDEHNTGIPMQYLLQLGVPSNLEGVDVIEVDHDGKEVKGKLKVKNSEGEKEIECMWATFGGRCSFVDVSGVYGLSTSVLPLLSFFVIAFMLSPAFPSSLLPSPSPLTFPQSPLSFPLCVCVCSKWQQPDLEFDCSRPLRPGAC